MDDLASTLRSWANEIPQADFLERVRGHYLMIAAAPPSENDFAFNTRTASHARLMQAAAAALKRQIVALEKTGRSPYSSHISVGRTRNCDVVLREPSVSKLHAHFFKREQSWQVVDRGSANGTMLNGRKLVPDEPSLVKAGDQLVFGTIACLFADGRVLYNELGPDGD